MSLSNIAIDEKSIRLFPNPVTSYFSLNFEVNAVKDVRIINIEGKDYEYEFGGTNEGDFKAKKEGTKLSSSERYEIANNLLDHKIAQKQEMKKILSDEQFNSWEKMNKGRERGRKGKRGGRDRNQEGRKDRKTIC